MLKLKDDYNFLKQLNSELLQVLEIFVDPKTSFPFRGFYSMLDDKELRAIEATYRKAKSSDGYTKAKD